MSSTPLKFDHRKLMTALEGLTQASRRLDLSELMQEVTPFLERYRAGLFPLPIMGEVKVGKSTFLSTLLEHPGLLPTDTDVATSTVYKIHYGAEVLYRVHFLPAVQTSDDARGHDLPAPKVVAREELETYGTENGNPGNERNVDFIEVQCPHPLLKAGVVLVDLPGLGGVVKRHAQLVMQYMPGAAGVIYVVASTEVIGELDTQWIKRLRSRFAPPPIVFVQSKVDLAGTAQAEARRARNLDILQEATGLAAAQIPYFPVSSVFQEALNTSSGSGEAGDTGLRHFRHFIDTVIIPRKQDLLAMPLWTIARDGLSERLEELGEQLNLAATSDKSELDAIDRKARDSREQLENWKRTDMEDIFTDFNDALDESSREAEDKIARELDPLPHGPVIGARLEYLKDSNTSATDLIECVDDERDALVSQCDETLNAAVASFDRAASEAYREASDSIGGALRSLANVSRMTVSHDVGEARPWVPNSAFEVGRNTFYGFSFGAGTAGAIVGMLFPPFAVAAAVVGGLLGAFELFSVSRSRQRKAVLESIRTMLSETNRRLLDESQKSTRRYVADVRKQMLRTMRTAITRKEDSLKRELQDIADQRRATAEESQRKQGELKQQVSLLAVVLRQLNEAGATAGPKS